MFVILIFAASLNVISLPFLRRSDPFDELTQDLIRKNDLENCLPLRRTETHLFIRCSSSDFKKLSKKTYLGLSTTRSFLSLQVKRCFKCQGIGHHQSSCAQEEPVCSSCGNSGHLANSCTSLKKHCVLCRKDGHSSDDYKNCPALCRAQAYKRSLMRL